MSSLPERQQIVQWVDEAQAAGARRARACQVIGLRVRTLQRWREDGELRCDRRTVRSFEPRNKLSADERAQILKVVNSTEFGSLPPGQVVPILAERGVYLASESSLYRILHAAQQLQHRQASRPAQARARPKALQASAPNQIYCWDITYLPMVVRGTYCYLYLFLDLYSRKIVGWRVEAQERSEFAASLLGDIAAREGLLPGQVVLHSDNGAPMKGSTLLATLQRLGIEPSFSRPSVSNDNPYAEALFRTAKYRPQYPERPFDDIAAARRWTADFVDWYNHVHRHSAIRFVTPAQRHAGLDRDILRQRHDVYLAARRHHPERWSGATRNWNPITVVHLNPNKNTTNTSDRQTLAA